MNHWKKDRRSSANVKLPEPARSLAYELGSTLDGEVRFDAGSRPYTAPMLPTIARCRSA
jgi:hypothetical protein